MYIPFEVENLIFQYLDNLLLLSLQIHDNVFTKYSPSKYRWCNIETREFYVKKCIYHCAKNSHDDLIQRLMQLLHDKPYLLMFDAAIEGKNINLAKQLVSYGHVPANIVNACLIHDLGMIELCIKNMNVHNAFILNSTTILQINQLREEKKQSKIKDLENYKSFKKTRCQVQAAIYFLCRYKHDLHTAYLLIKQYYHYYINEESLNTYHMEDFFRYSFFAMGYFSLDLQTIDFFIKLIQQEFGNFSKSVGYFVRGVFGSTDRYLFLSKGFKCRRKIDYNILMELDKKKDMYQIGNFYTNVQFYHGLIAQQEYKIVENLFPNISRDDPRELIHVGQDWLQAAVRFYKDATVVEWVNRLVNASGYVLSLEDLRRPLSIAMAYKNTDAMVLLFKLGARTRFPYMYSFSIFLKYLELLKSVNQSMSSREKRESFIYAIRKCNCNLFLHILDTDSSIVNIHQIFYRLSESFKRCSDKTVAITNNMNFEKMFNLVYQKCGPSIFHEWICRYYNDEKHGDIETDPVFVKFVGNYKVRIEIILFNIEKVIQNKVIVPRDYPMTSDYKRIQNLSN